ncbi:MAG: hypothetical protein D6808_05140 [Candidatus Dadabacteria bacterium]|nr:MAG: hypothetical protein D6808_05140 [Candidatus Dadabacteria bacterium]
MVIFFKIWVLSPYLFLTFPSLPCFGIAKPLRSYYTNMFMGLRKVAVSALAVAAGVLVYLLLLADTPSKGGLAVAEGTSTVDLSAGVYNAGKAAPWDFKITDHYKYFNFPERAEGYAPKQPINFSHKLHVSTLGLECQFCHWSVTKSPFAAIPEEDVCMGCHNLLIETDRTRKSEGIKKLKEYYSKGEPIPWQKVHVMPDYVRFNHKRHIKAGVACHECHGQVPQMDVVQRVSSMKMGWCVKCHRERGTSIDCAVCHK